MFASGYPFVCLSVFPSYTGVARNVCYDFSYDVRLLALTISKLLEGLAVVRLRLHICCSHIWNILKSAYSHGHSTETVLCKILDDIIVAAASGHITDLVSLHVSAAFDVVDHAVLIQQLEDEFGVTGTCKNWSFGYSLCRCVSITCS